MLTQVVCIPPPYPWFVQVPMYVPSWICPHAPDLPKKLRGQLWHESLQEASKDGNTVELFANVCGIYFQVGDTPLPDTIKRWNVRKLVLDRQARHNDASTVNSVFDTITKFLDARVNNAAASRKVCKPTKIAYK